MQVVCVIDDDPAIRKGVANLLRSAGYQPVCFESGASFLASPWRAQAACVLLDLNMPGLHGTDVQRALRGQGAAPPVICMSAQASQARVEEILALGATGFLAKPFTAEALLDAISNSCTGLP
ncbi:MAG TPA: response regulator [Chitinolyticbacter sp.]|nr:response regulator [Chitinolyticbacter sp.]